MLALLQETTFEIYRVTYGPGNPYEALLNNLVAPTSPSATSPGRNTRRNLKTWGFHPMCRDKSFGSHSTISANNPWRIISAMSDKVLCIGLPNLSVEVYDISGEYMGTINLAHPCRLI